MAKFSMAKILWQNLVW